MVAFEITQLGFAIGSNIPAAPLAEKVAPVAAAFDTPYFLFAAMITARTRPCLRTLSADNPSVYRT
jgi:hypothetical protein